MKTYVLMISRTFPATHPRKGQPTFFIEKIISGQCREENCNDKCSDCKLMPFVIDFSRKLHTIRGNFKLWEKRIKAIQEGKAILSLRYWSASPYNFKKDGSKQIEFARLDKDSGIGIQEFMMYSNETAFVWPKSGENIQIKVSWDGLALNDGLNIQDFKDWFSKYDLPELMGIIQFTPFRY